MSLSSCRNTSGPDTNCALASVYQSLSWSVFGSSATIAFEYPDPPAVWPGPMAAMTMPLVVNATDPTGLPPAVFQETTGFASLERSIAHTALGAPPQPAAVDV